MTEEQKVSPIIYIYDDETITAPIGWGGGEVLQKCVMNKNIMFAGNQVLDLLL